MGVEEFKKDDLTDLAIECRSSSKSTMVHNKLVCKENSLIVNEDFDVCEDGFVVSEKFNTRLKQTEYQKVEVIMNGLEHKLLGFYLKLDIRDNKVKLKCGNKLIPIKVNKRVKRRLKINYFLNAKLLTQHFLSRKHYICIPDNKEEITKDLFPFIYKLENSICNTLGIKKHKDVDFGTTVILQNQLREKKQKMLHNILKEVNMQVNKTEVDGGILVHGVEGKGKSVLDIPELTEEEYKAVWDKIDKDILERSKGMLKIAQANRNPDHWMQVPINRSSNPMIGTPRLELNGEIQEDLENKDELFNSVLSRLCKNDHWKAVPTVSDILLSISVPNKEFMFTTRLLLLSLFFIMQGNKRSIKEIRLQEYVNFIRLRRNKLYNIDFKVRNRKFISGRGTGISGMSTGKPFKIYRSMSVEDYINILYIENGVAK